MTLNQRPFKQGSGVHGALLSVADILLNQNSDLNQLEFKVETNKIAAHLATQRFIVGNAEGKQCSMYMSC